ncbi:COG4223 family protein [Devosia sp. ZW T5_3]|uniref:COG4223 family protein n=1 Tax=Devosia sp. ZW T5_3 TaxID=3378085 RepID=UPI0038535480
MADPKGNDPKATQGKAADNPAVAKPEPAKSGAVRPPVLDLQARETGAGAKKPETPREPVDKPAAESVRETPKPSSSAPPPRASSPVLPAIAGGVLGLAAAYGLAWFGLWPTTPAPTPAADPRLARFASAIPELETVTNTTQSELATLTRRVAGLESNGPASSSAEPVDLAPIQTEISALTQRIDTLANAPAAPGDTTAVEGLRTELAGLTTRLDELGARLGSAEANLRNLDTTVSQTSATLADQPSDIGAVLQLPLILSSFEAAFSTGRPYETELAALRAAVPDATIPTSIANAAASGLPRPDVIAQRFADVLPAILAGRPADPSAGWQDGAVDWFRSAIALRPTGEMEGDSPDAIASRLEGAIARRDFAAAKTLFDSLPAPMLSAAGDVPALVATQAEAASFLEQLRAQALAGEVRP